MKNILLFIMFCIGLSDSIAQQTIFGVVVDTYGAPIPYVIIHQKDSKIYNTSSTDGSFHVRVEEQYSRKLVFRKEGYQVHEFELTNNSKEIIKIVLEKNIDLRRYNRSPSKIFSFSPRQWHLSFYLDWMSSDFKQFEANLGEENIDLMNRMDAAFGVELGFSKNRFYHGYTTALSFITNTKNDSIKKELNKSLFGLQVGYKIVDSKRLTFMPTFGVKWYKYRLFNYDKERKISLNQFLSQRRDLDIRLRQATGHLGGNLSFKIKPKNKDVSNNGYWSVGIYGNYIFKLRKQPNVRVKHTRLTTDHIINISNYNFGIHFTGNIMYNR